MVNKFILFGNINLLNVILNIKVFFCIFIVIEFKYVVDNGCVFNCVCCKNRLNLVDMILFLYYFKFWKSYMYINYY